MWNCRRVAVFKLFNYLFCCRFFILSADSLTCRAVIQHPIVEGGPPSSIDAFEPIIDQVLSLLFSGASILCHCRGGVGRAGLLASCVLLASAVCALPGDAIALVRKRRCGCFALSEEHPPQSYRFERNIGVRLPWKQEFKKISSQSSTVGGFKSGRVHALQITCDTAVVYIDPIILHVDAFGWGAASLSLYLPSDITSNYVEEE
jgi:protein-tyrosine phosphatase